MQYKMINELIDAVVWLDRCRGMVNNCADNASVYELKIAEKEAAEVLIALVAELNITESINQQIQIQRKLSNRTL